ncbi:hypothetical protein PENSPDRAFT_694559 [Peniophora sp. CONT]|nr:hypothetical protein PENSPDRAFT_694559 [Peniophora sp. CONT]
MSDVIVLAQGVQGPILAGLFFNLMLLGISITQTYFFFGANTKDKTWVKNLIIFLFIMDVMNSVFDMIYIYEVLINHNGDLLAMSKTTWSFSTDPMCTGIIGGVVQGFFGWRVKVLTGSTFAAVLIWFFATVQCLAGIGTGIAVIIVPEFLKFQTFTPITVVWLAGSAVCDVMITLLLVFYLRKHKTGYTYTDAIVDRIIRLTVQTGMITSVVAIIDMTLYLTSPKAYHMAFNFTLAKLYTNSLLSSLNARKGWAYSTGSQPSREMPSNSAGVSSGRRPGEVIKLGQLGSQHTRPQVFVAVESHQVVDDSHAYDKKVDFSDESLSGARSTKTRHEQEVDFDQSFVPEVHAS